MKHLLLWLLMASICQGCYSYKHADATSTNLVLHQKYRIKLKDKTFKATLTALNDSTITVLKGSKEMQIKRSDIREIKSRHFSLLKTVGYSAATLVAFVGIYVVAESAD